MSLRDKMITQEQKERYDRNYYSVETTFTQKELEEHDAEIRAKAITEFAERIKQEIENCSWQFSRLESGTIDKIATELKEKGC